jgi:aerobic-type carbon monoxide dehydrogenase small subunit (CoxS/CutS family)
MSEALYPITVEVNGVARTAQVQARLSLVDWLRDARSCSTARRCAPA